MENKKYITVGITAYKEGKFLQDAFDSVKNVDTASSEKIISSVERVIESYGANGSEANEILVQPMINEVSMSGVIFSHDLSTGAPYYVINYDDQSGRTDTITSGTTDTSRTLLVYRGQVNQLQSTRFGKLIRAVQEIEKLTSASGLDIEFAVTKDEVIYIFQARRMAVRGARRLRDGRVHRERARQTRLHAARRRARQGHADAAGGTAGRDPSLGPR